MSFWGMNFAQQKGAAIAALFLFAPAFAAAAPLTPADKSALAGEWKTKCGETAADGSVLRMIVEFEATGGTLALDDGTEGAGEYRIRSGNIIKDHITLNLGDQGEYKFVRKGAELKAVAGDAAGNSFTRCHAAADRKSIKLDARALRFLSVAMPPDRPIFVDTRVKGNACKATAYQYLTIDLVGPVGFRMGRWNSWALGEKIVDGKKSPFDEVSNFIVEKAESMGGNYRLTVTELIPPNGARGDTTSLTLIPSAQGVVTIPEWKRSYRRCARADLAAQ